MPRAPLPLELQHFIDAARPAIIATIRPDGAPSTTATWYRWVDGRVLVNMVASGPRARNLRNDPRVSLTILGESWYDHVSLLGRAVEFRDDTNLKDLDMLSTRYTGQPYPKRHLTCVSVLIEIERWHSWGDPGAALSPTRSGGSSATS